jgi:hypothetical protein
LLILIYCTAKELHSQEIFLDCVLKCSTIIQDTMSDG